MSLTRRDVLRHGALVAGAAMIGPMALGARANRLDYEQLDATAMADLVRRGEASALELLNQALDRVEQWNPVLNAVVLKHYDRARKTAAARPEGPLGGVPFLLKDLGTRLAGTITTEGSRFFRDAVAEQDSDVVARYRQAGLVIFGKTASPELGQSAATDSRLWGVTRNPWNTDYSPGGSSGGAAAAVAAGILPVAHGTDGGGSIRIPASCCGLFGLKPSRFRVPLGPGRGDGHGMSVTHVLSRSVRDSALFLDISQGPELGGYGGIPAPDRPYVEQLQQPLKPLRIGLMTQPIVDLPVDEDCVLAAEQAARLCESLGHAVEPVTLPVDGMPTLTAAGLLLTTGAMATLRAREQQLGRSLTEDDVEPILWQRIHQDSYAKASALDIHQARAMQVSAHRAMAEFMERYDVILSPTLPLRPGRVDRLRHDQPIEDFDRNVGPYGLFTILYNFTGQPAMSLPLHWSEDGLPIGVQCAGRYGEEALLLQLAAQLEQAQPWQDRRPALPK